MKPLPIAFLCLAFITTNAKKNIIPFEILLFQADEIVFGEVLEVHQKYYVFEIMGSVNHLKQLTIKVRHFKEWPCDVRCLKLEKGQKILLLTDKKIAKYNTLNGSSGEIFIKDKEVISRSILASTPFNGKELIDVLTNLRASYRLRKTEAVSWGTYPQIEQVKSNEEISAFRLASKNYAFLYDTVKRRFPPESEFKE